MTSVTIPRPPVLPTEVRFVEPLLGFPDEDAFTLTPIDPDGVLLALRSARDPGLRFVLTPAEVFFPDYRPSLVDAVGPALGVESAGELRVLLMLTIGTGLSDATANLRGPVVLAPATGRVLQVVLDDATLPMRQPLLA